MAIVIIVKYKIFELLNDLIELFIIVSSSRILKASLAMNF